MTNTAFLAVDMGASSGRHVAGLFDGQRLALEEEPATGLVQRGDVFGRCLRTRTARSGARTYVETSLFGGIAAARRLTLTGYSP